MPGCMSDMDLGMLAELLNVPAEGAEVVDTPRKISVLGSPYLSNR
jgi:hypothetical protein